MSLHVDRYEHRGSDSGAPLLLIHGWGMHGGMWRGVAEQLAQHCDVYAVDLPGHGYSELPSPAGGRGGGGEGRSASLSLDSLVDQLSAQFDEPLAVCGWSLGGQVALRWALRHPQQVERLVMVASTPCFVRLDGWKYALSAEILEEFAVNLQKNYAMTLKRFLSLQMRGSEQEREVLAVLRDGLFSRGEPNLAALQAGLEILRGSDQRAALPELRQATLVLAGERDTLIPHQATQYLADRIPDGRLATIRGAAHAPFLSHPDEFVGLIKDFLKG
ncbi:MAG: pimeloyl-ACP methyl ester esterase BioH [Nitrosomonadales bacterium]|nr:pimeloyl-ACP methyl ester esterase BioH [Nitrosomonadales bacterium]